MRYSRAVAAWALGLSLLWTGAAAGQQPVSPDAFAAAKQMVEASKAADQMKTLLPLLMQQLKPVVAQGRPEVERDYDKIVPLMLEAMNSRVQEFSDAMATIYARNFTADELRQITAFYETPVGQKFLTRMGPIAQDALVVGQKFGQEIAKDLRERVVEELRKRGHNI